ncbi:MAG TPA: hypothetical protein VGV35_11595, partial [Bryobacteraceae bacterium]|nr:hypothetical protein [Bryobacteraceae bacterium]
MLFNINGANSPPPESNHDSPSLFGFREASAELKAESRFLSVPDPKRAEEHLRVLTQVPHI